ncbi:MAG: TRAP transporter substrate-binding protein DctP [Gemmatimonadetes bacterium]|nr:TRAP transporter substrate-binding protein DctP [Gemmatimonadota bacterium]
MKSLRTILMAALAVTLVSADALAAKPKVHLKIATLAPEGSTWMNLMHELDDRVREATANEVGFKFYGGGVQGDERLVLRKMRNGQLHGGGFTGNGLGVVAPALRVLELPFGFQDETEIDAVYAEMGDEFEGILQESGHVLLGWAEVGFVHIFTQKPLTTLGDLRNMKMWLWEGDPLAEAFFAEADVSPVSLSITDVYTSLQTGLVDGVYSSPYGAVVLQWHSQVKAMSESPITHAIGAVVVTEKAWKKISPESQAKVREIADDVFARLKASSREENRQAMDDIRAAGIQVTPVSPEALQVFQEIGERAARHNVGKLYTEDLLNRVRGVISAHRTAGDGEVGSH